MDTYVVAIAGATSSGKTTVASAVKEGLEKKGIESTLISLDNYYLPQDHLTLEQRQETNYDVPAQIEIDLAVNHIASLKQGRQIEMPLYDFVTHTRKGSKDLDPQRVTIVEGIFALCYGKLLEHVDLPVYIDTDPIIWTMRRLEKDIEKRGRTFEYSKGQIKTSVRGGFLNHILPSRQNASIYLNWNDDSDTEQAFDILLNYLLSKLGF